MKIIQRGPETVRLDVTQGAGWQPAGRGQLDASSNTYPELASIQATDCTGLRVYDFDAPGQPLGDLGTPANTLGGATRPRHNHAPARQIPGGTDRRDRTALDGHRRRAKLHRRLLRGGRADTRLRIPRPGGGGIYHAPSLAPVGGGHRGA